MGQHMIGRVGHAVAEAAYELVDAPAVDAGRNHDLVPTRAYRPDRQARCVEAQGCVRVRAQPSIAKFALSLADTPSRLECGRDRRYIDDGRVRRRMKLEVRCIGWRQ